MAAMWTRLDEEFHRQGSVSKQAATRPAPSAACRSTHQSVTAVRQDAAGDARLLALSHEPAACPSSDH